MHLIPARDLLNHVARRYIVVRLVQQGFMFARIERLAGRIDRLDMVILEHLHELVVDNAHAVGDGVRVLLLSRTTGMPYVPLDAETVYRQEYPLARTFHVVTRVPGVQLGGGFITYATSDVGQMLVKNAGFVPATVPVRFTRRLPAAATHAREPGPAPGSEERDSTR